ncbi:hypothetical protein KHA96_18530 [Bacillus sp. FJAT-49711]|uniref:hypothetical protein n=1 Tax=Bacillus sp. FJAT-49711 TaxID=2833585 RepID=UPI001BCA23AB|nr:hypothetical protein [Bacillus sp. FJAT-49711]MBS4220301.1 hypothetical protein [Bacillus sp. FJAT-49711]
MDKKFITEMTNTAVISGWLFNIICLLGKVLPWFSLIAILGRGIGGLIYLFNIFALILLVMYGWKKIKEGIYLRNLIFIILFLIIFPMIFNKTMSLI